MSPRSLLALACTAGVLAGCDASDSTFDTPAPSEAPMPIADGSGLDVRGGTLEAEVWPDHYIVVLDETVTDVQATIDELLFLLDADVLFTYTDALPGFAVRMSEADAQLLGLNPLVSIVEPDFLVSLLPIFQSPPEDQPSEMQMLPYGIRDVGGPFDGAGQRAWVLDTGIDMDHADLSVDQTRSRTFATGTTSADDQQGHGTHVAGTIGALDNGIDVVGVAAGASLVSVRVLGADGSGSYSSIIAGLDYTASAAAPGDVANLSLGGPASDALDQAVIGVAENGILVSIAAGNDAENANNTSPARVNHPNVYTISAVGNDNGFAFFSNFGNPPVDYAAPGVNVLSTRLGGGTTYLSGTSMAAPHVAGLLLLGDVQSRGTATGDPDGTPDPLAVRR